MPLYDFKDPKTGKTQEVYVKSAVPVGTVLRIGGVDYVREVCAPQRTASSWSESAETNSPFYSHLTGGMVKSRRDEDKIAQDKGLHRLNHWDAIKADHVESQRRREEDELLATPLPDLNEIINAPINESVED